MDQPTFQIARTTLARRCEICHQSDCFDPVQEVCSRCSGTSVDLTTNAEPQTAKPSIFIDQGLVFIKPTTTFRGFLTGIKVGFRISIFFLGLAFWGFISLSYGHHAPQPRLQYWFELGVSMAMIVVFLTFAGGLAGLFWGWIFSIWERYDQAWEAKFGKKTAAQSAGRNRSFS